MARSYQQFSGKSSKEHHFHSFSSHRHLLTSLACMWLDPIRAQSDQKIFTILLERLLSSPVILLLRLSSMLFGCEFQQPTAEYVFCYFVVLNSFSLSFPERGVRERVFNRLDNTQCYRGASSSGWQSSFASLFSGLVPFLGVVVCVVSAAGGDSGNGGGCWPGLYGSCERRRLGTEWENFQLKRERERKRGKTSRSAW